MKIGSVNGTQGVNRYEAARRTAGTHAPVQYGTDKAEFSKDALSFAATYKAVKAGVAQRTPEEARRISEIGQRVDEGAYSVETRLVAQSILKGIDAIKHG